MSLGGLDKARAVEGLTWLLVAAMNDGVPVLRLRRSGRAMSIKERQEKMTSSNAIAGRDLETLRTATTGDVFAPGDHGYDEARRAWNLATDERPSLVVVAESAADVAHAVRYARSRGMRIAPQGTGHGSEPLEPLEGAMLLRTVRMRGVRIDAEARIARAEAGALWQDVRSEERRVGKECQ